MAEERGYMEEGRGYMPEDRSYMIYLGTTHCLQCPTLGQIFRLDVGRPNSKAPYPLHSDKTKNLSCVLSCPSYITISFVLPSPNLIEAN